MAWFNEREKRMIAEYQRIIDDLTEQLEAAKEEAISLKDERGSWEQGQDELIEGHQVQLIEYLEQIQKLLDENKELKAVVALHEATCLPDFKNYMPLDEDVSTTER